MQRELEGSSDVQLTTPALSLENPLEKELNTSVLDGHLCLHIPEFCQDLGMLRKLTVQTTGLDLRCLGKVENGSIKWPKLCWSLHMLEKLHKGAGRLLTLTPGSQEQWQPPLEREQEDVHCWEKVGFNSWGWEGENVEAFLFSGMVASEGLVERVKRERG